MNEFYHYLHKKTGKIFSDSRVDAIHQSSIKYGHELEFCISSIDQFDFKRKYNNNFSNDVKDFLYRLKNQFKKINLWYSGGLDSHFILNNFIKHDIPLDEITTCVKLPFDNHFFSQIAADEVYSALPFIKGNYSNDITDYISRHRVKISTPVVGSKEFTAFYENPEWIKQSNSGSIRSAVYEANIMHLIDFDKDPKICNLFGLETPNVFYDDGWKFSFFDRAYVPNISLMFNPSGRDPLFVESFVNAIIDQLEKIPNYQKKFNKPNNLPSKFGMRRIPEIQEANSTIFCALHKNFTYKDKSTIISLINSRYFKSYNDYRSALILNPLWFQHYCNLTDWNAVKKDYYIGEIRTKNFTIK